MLDDDTRKLLHEVGDAAGAIGDDALVERFYHEHEIGTLFDRCRGMFGALVLLVDHGFVQEAAVFCRPMFVDSLALAEIAEADEQRRVSLIVGRQLDAIADIEGIFRELQARGDEVAKNLDHMAERRRKVEQYAYRRDASTRHWNPEDQAKALADKHARGDQYASYRMTSHFVHGSAAITEHRSSVDEEDVARIGAPHLDVEIWERPTALFGAYSLALASRAVSSIFGYEEPHPRGSACADRSDPERSVDRTVCELRGERRKRDLGEVGDGLSKSVVQLGAVALGVGLALCAKGSSLGGYAGPPPVCRTRWIRSTPSGS